MNLEIKVIEEWTVENLVGSFEQTHFDRRVTLRLDIIRKHT